MADSGDERPTDESNMAKARCTWNNMLLENHGQTLIGLDKRHPVQLVSATDDNTEWKLQITPLDPSGEPNGKPFIELQFTRCVYDSKTAQISCILNVRDSSGDSLFSKTLEEAVMKEGDSQVLCTAMQAKNFVVESLLMMFITCDVDIEEVELEQDEEEESKSISTSDQEPASAKLDDDDKKDSSDIPKNGEDRVKKIHTPKPPRTNKPNLKILDDYEKLFDEHEFGDVVLCVGDDQIIAYRGILAIRSPYFRAMFTATHRDKRKVDIEGVHFEVFQEIVRYMYTGRTPKVSKLARELFKAADQFQMTDLKETCAEEISSQMTVDTVADDLLLSMLHDAENLKDTAIEFIRRHRKEVFKTRGWRSLFRDHFSVAGEVILEFMEPDDSE